MEKQRRKAIKGKRLVLYLYMMLVLLTLLTVASYTWFTLSQTPRVSDMYMFINAQTGLELSTDPQAEEWVQQLDFREMSAETSPLRPVTWSQQDQRFYAAAYGYDGRRTGEWHALSDEQNANRDDVYGYYIKATFFARSETAVGVSLSPAVEVSEGVQGSGTYLVGVPVWDGEEIVHINGGLGAQNAVRIGLRVTPVDNSGLPTGGASEFFIYEPNCNGHLFEEFGYTATPSIDGAETLVDEAHLIRQTVSSWSEADPVQRTVVIHRMGDFIDDTKIFTLPAGGMVQIELYVWLEGQDVDCTNEIQKAQILANVQFDADAEGQTGLVPIPNG